MKRRAAGILPTLRSQDSLLSQTDPVVPRYIYQEAAKVKFLVQGPDPSIAGRVLQRDRREELE
jgi:hypothetical protein